MLWKPELERDMKER